MAPTLDQHVEVLERLELQMVESEQRVASLEIELEAAIQKELEAHPDKRPMADFGRPPQQIRKRLEDAKKTLRGLVAEVPRRQAIVQSLRNQEHEQELRERLRELEPFRGEYEALMAEAMRRHQDFFSWYLGSGIRDVAARFEATADELRSLASGNVEHSQEVEAKIAEARFLGAEQNIPQDFSGFLQMVTGSFHVRQLEDADDLKQAIVSNPSIVQGVVNFEDSAIYEEPEATRYVYLDPKSSRFEVTTKHDWNSWNGWQRLTMKQAEARMVGPFAPTEPPKAEPVSSFMGDLALA